MDPCPFVRLIVESLALKLHTTTTTTSACFAKLKLTNFPSQTTSLPITAADTTAPLPESHEASAGASFDIDPETLRGLSCNSKTVLLTLKLSVYLGYKQQMSTGLGSCGVAHARGKLLGSAQVCVNLGGQMAQSRPCVYHSGWMKLSGHNDGYAAKLHVTVRSEPDPRYMFQFGGEPECSPVVYQIQGNNNVRQPIFSCKFTADRNNNRSRSLPSDFSSKKKTWSLRRTLSLDKERAITSRRRERKGWMVIIYDLSGSAVAAASMVTPFVPSPNSDRVSRSNPGAWLILRPNSLSASSWKPWGRLEAWRDRKGKNDALGYKFDLVDDTGLSNGIPVAEGTIGVRKGGDFRIDDSTNYYMGFGYLLPVRGFVMGSNVEGEGRVSKPTVRVGAQYVTCMADAALFVALSAAVDLSMDACRVFSSKLRKEFGSDEQEQSFS